MTSSKKVVVLDTSPIIYLSALGLIDILKDLFGKVIIPEAVNRELLAGGKKSPGYKEVSKANWITVNKIKNQASKRYLLSDLDDGEAEVIIISDEIGADLMVMDDRLGRKVAKLKGLKVVGTVRILISAEKKGLISDLKTTLDMLKKQGFWLSDDIYEIALKDLKM